MPKAEYSVYAPVSIVPKVEEYCEKNDLSHSEAFLEAMRRELQREEIDDE